MIDEDFAAEWRPVWHRLKDGGLDAYSAAQYPPRCGALVCYVHRTVDEGVRVESNMIRLMDGNIPAPGSPWICPHCRVVLSNFGPHADGDGFAF